jgi:carboxypeptidase C (cathepsin A)
MNRASRYGIFALLVVSLTSSPNLLQAQDKDEKSADKDKKAAQAAPPPVPKEESSVTDHTIKLGGQTIPYKATAQTVQLKDDKGEPTAMVYSTAYTRSDVKDPSTRPVAFVFV